VKCCVLVSGFDLNSGKLTKNKVSCFNGSTERIGRICVRGGAYHFGRARPIGPRWLHPH